MIDSYILQVARDQSFLDVGPLYGKQRLSVAHQGGASSLSCIDVEPKASPQWSSLARELGPLYDQTNFICGDVCNLTGSYDVVACCNVLYHSPTPLRIMQQVNAICKNWTIVSSTYTDCVVQNHRGRAEVRPGAAVYLPELPPDQLEVYREDWRPWLNGQPGDILSHPVGDWNLNPQHHWYFLFTVEFLERLFNLVGFEIADRHAEGKIATFLLKKG